MYVGKTSDFPTRLKTHAFATFWFKDVRTIELVPIESSEIASSTEVAFIRAFRPKYNIHHAVELSVKKSISVPCSMWAYIENRANTKCASVSAIIQEALELLKANVEEESK